MRWFDTLKAALRTPPYAVQVVDGEDGDLLTVGTYFTADAAQEAAAEWTRGGQAASWVRR